MPVVLRTFSRRIAQSGLLLRFSLLSVVVLAIIGFGLGWMVQRQMEQTALMQQADEVAVVIDGILTRHITAHDLTVPAGPVARAQWRRLAQTLLDADHHVIWIKVWDPHGTVVYSNNPRQLGKWYPVDESLRVALDGRRSMDVSDLTRSENALDRTRYSRLLETYIPIRASNRVVGAYEVYSDLRAVEVQLQQARRVIWTAVALGFLILFASLFAIARSASRRLVRQTQAISELEARAREAATLRQVDIMKDDFISGVSHELRRPLASIKGYTASLLLPNAKWDPQVQRDCLEVIDEEADHLSHMIDNLLDLARLDGKSLQLTPEPVHLPSLTERVVVRLRSMSHLPTHPYEVRFASPFPVVEADQSRIEQLLLNLLENAAKYSPPGAPILVEGTVHGDAIEIRVVDRGRGMTPEQQDHVFERFYRVDSGLTRGSEGTGLGLAICRGVVEAHGGEISVLSTPNGGSTFIVRLPRFWPESMTQVLTARGA